MAEGSSGKLHRFAAPWPAALATLLLGCGLPLLDGVPELRAGDNRDLELAAGASQEFLVRLEAGWQLHLEIDQRGLDVAIEVSGIPGLALPTMDLPLGYHVREELRLVSPEAAQARIRIFAIGGRGRPRLRVLSLGPAEGQAVLRAREFALFWQGCADPSRGPASARHLEGLARHASEAALRAASASVVANWVRSADPAHAIELLDPALADHPEPAIAAQLLVLRGWAAGRLGRSEELRSALVAARAAAFAAGDLAAAGLAEHELGRLAWDENHSAAAIARFAAARRHFAAANVPDQQEAATFSLARSLMRQGSSPEPLALLLQALAQLEKQANEKPADAAQRADLLREIGWWLMLEGRASEGSRLTARAAALTPDAAGSWQRLAMTEIAARDFPAARKHLASARALTTDKGTITNLEASLCSLEVAAGRPEIARAQCLEALDRAQAVGPQEVRPDILYELARAEAELGLLTEAERHATTATAAFEEQRLLAGNDQQRMDFLAVRTRAYQLLVDLRWRLFATTADPAYRLSSLVASEATRARALRDLLELEEVDRRNLPDALTRRRAQELRQILAIRARGLVETLLAAGELPPAEAKGLAAPLVEIDELRAAQPFAAETDAAPDLALLHKTATFELAAIDRELEPSTLVLVYHLGEGEAYGWALLGGQLRAVSLGPAGRLRRLAGAVATQLATEAILPRTATDGWSAKLADQLLSPFAAEIRQASQLVVVAPAELQRVPWSALPFPADQDEPLVASHPLTALPSLAILPALRRRVAGRAAAPRRLLVVDDPVYDQDPRRPAGVEVRGRWRRLPDTADEALEVLALARFEPGETAPSREAAGENLRLTGFAANRERLMAADLAQFQVLHFATHARTESPPRGLILSRFAENGRKIGDTFGLPELYARRLGADLAVASACSSALGEEVAGEGLLGLVHGFFEAGVPRLLLTLWPVHGAAARAMVRRFYRHLFAGLPPPRALQQAQVEMWCQGRDPHDWAAFALYGDWRGLPNFPAGPGNTASACVSSVNNSNRERGLLNRKSEDIMPTTTRSQVSVNPPPVEKLPGDRTFDLADPGRANDLTRDGESQVEVTPIKPDKTDRGIG